MVVAAAAVMIAVDMTEVDMMIGKCGLATTEHQSWVEWVSDDALPSSVCSGYGGGRGGEM